MGVQLIVDAGIENPPSPFAGILEILMSAGGFSNFVAVITYTAALAAIMSTTDSVLIGMSQLVTVECIYPVIPEASPARLKVIGSITSAISLSIAICISVFGGGNISQLATIQFSLSLQIAPAFLIGLFATKRFDCHPYSILAGVVAGVITTICVHFVYMTKWKTGRVDGIPFDAGFGGFLANIGIIFMTEALGRTFLSRITTTDNNMCQATEQDVDTELSEGSKHNISQPNWDIPVTARFGEVDLTSSLMWEMMVGIREPFSESWAWTLLFLLLSVSCTPFGVGGVPPPR